MLPKSERPRWGDLLKDPLLHFLVAGAAIFAAFSTMQPTRAPIDEIIVTEADLAVIVAQYRQAWRSEPTPAELTALIDNLVLDEVIYREALALGLDQGDTVIRQRMRQKLEFILTATLQVAPPTEVELQAWFEAHRDSYAPPPVLQFDQVLLDDATEAEQVQAALLAGTDPATLGRATQLPMRVRAVSSAIDASFGPGFSAAVEALPIGDWAGPVGSSYGLHLVRVAAVTREPADFAAQRDSVQADWMRDAIQRRLDATYTAMREGYVVRLPGDLPQ